MSKGKRKRTDRTQPPRDGEARLPGGGQRRPSARVREQKRAQFVGLKKRSPLPIVLAAAAVAVAVIVGAFLLASGGRSSGFAQAQAVGDTVKIPLVQVSDGKAHFYSYDSGGTKVDYFVLQSKDGTVRAAFDAYDVCYPYKKGYHQSGDAMQCNNCGRVFPADKINVLQGGCNPAPLRRKVEGGNLAIAATAIEAGADYFL